MPKIGDDRADITEPAIVVIAYFRDDLIPGLCRILLMSSNRKVLDLGEAKIGLFRRSRQALKILRGKRIEISGLEVTKQLENPLEIVLTFLKTESMPKFINTIKASRFYRFELIKLSTQIFTKLLLFCQRCHSIHLCRPFSTRETGIEVFLAEQFFLLEWCDLSPTENCVQGNSSPRNTRRS